MVVEASIVETSTKDDIEYLFSSDYVGEFEGKGVFKSSNARDSRISSYVKLENVSKSYKGVTVLKNVSWEVKLMTCQFMIDQNVICIDFRHMN